MKVGLRSIQGAYSALGNLGDAQQEVGDHLYRLTMGTRDLNGGDQAIASDLKTDKRVFTKAIENVNDGISRFNVADDATTSLRSVLTSLQEYAAEASSSSLSGTQREAIQEESRALVTEYNRILRSVSIGDENPLATSSSSVSIQTGYSSFSLDIGQGVEGHNNQEIGATLDASKETIWPNAISYSGDYVMFTTEKAVDANGEENDVYIMNTQTNSITQVNLDSADAEWSGAGSYSIGAGMSSDGRYALFYTTKSGISLDDGSSESNGFADLFVRDTLLGTTELVSRDATGGASSAGVGNSTFSISSDGRYVAFTSASTDLVASDLNGHDDVFLRDLLTNTTTLISKHSDGTQADGDSSGAFISGDGRYVSYSSEAENLVSDDTNLVTDTFRYDTLTGITTRTSVTSDGSQLNNSSAGGRISEDGRFTLFESTTDSLGYAGGIAQVYRHDNDTGETVLVSRNDGGGAGNGYSLFASISADGRQIAYQSAATNLVSGDTNNKRDIFVTDVEAGITRRVSVADNGTQGNDNSSGLVSGGDPYSTYQFLISGNGEYVFYDSFATNLISGGTVKSGAGILSGNPLAEESVVKPIVGLNLSNPDFSERSATLLDEHDQDLTKLEGLIAAGQSRLAAAYENVTALSNNYAYAESKITELDDAKELAGKLKAESIVSSSTNVIQAGIELTQNIMSLLEEAARIKF